MEETKEKVDKKKLSKKNVGREIIIEELMIKKSASWKVKDKVRKIGRFRVQNYLLKNWREELCQKVKSEKKQGIKQMCKE